MFPRAITWKTRPQLVCGILDVLFAGDLLIPYQALWIAVREHLNPCPYSYANYVAANDSLKLAGWIELMPPPGHGEVRLTTSAWLLLCKGRYPCAL